MKYQELEIKGAWLIEHSVFGDSRGKLERILDRTGSEQHGIDPSVDAYYSTPKLHLNARTELTDIAIVD